ncbi:tape measure protein [Pectobacterium parmentieri]|uniref:tape measure protein n=2 Tax=Pectobacterium parmentieri TaxID=1905730 RepID=UPI003018C22B
MASDRQVGNIVYQVEMNVARLIDAQRRVDARLDRMESGFNRTASAAGNAERSFASLSRVAGALMAVISVQQVSAYADAWTQLNNKLSNSIRPNEQLADVTQRVFDITQATRSSLSATSTLYARLERGTREYNTSAADLAKLTTIINQGFVVSGATAQEAENAIIQLSQGIASGVLRGEEFNSVSEQGSRLMVALADSLGVGIGELRKMAAQGKLTTDVVVNGLLSQGDAIGKEFSNTVTTIGQAMQTAGNNITKFFGENATVKSGVNAFNSAVVTVSENIDVLSGALVAVATVMGSRYVGALTMATAAKLKDVVASRQAAIATRDSAAATANQTAATLRSSAAAKQRALDEVRLAEMMKVSAYNSASAAVAEQRLSAARVAAATAVGNYNAALAANTAAQTAATAAARSASIGIGMFRNAMALVGGPMGAAMLAGAAVFYFTQQAKEARDAANTLADGVNDLTDKFRSMSSTQIAASIAKLRQNIPELSAAVDEAQRNFDKASDRVANLQREIDRYGTATTRGKQAANAISSALDEQAIAAGELERANRRLSQTLNAIDIGRANLNGTMKQGIDLLRRDGQEAGIAAGMMNKLGEAISFASRAKETFNSSSLQVTRSAEADKLLKNLNEENALLAITDKRQRAVAEARQKAIAAGAEENSNQLRQIEEAAAAKFDLQQAESERNRETKSAQKAETQAEQAEKRRRKTLQDLGNEMAVAELKAKRLNREAAQLAAVQDLGAGASQQQIQQATQQAGQIFDVQQRMADKKAALDQNALAQAERIRADDLAQLQRQLVAGDISFEQAQQRRAQIAATYAQQIAEANANASVTPQHQAVAQVDPVQSLANENARKLALMQQYEQQGLITHQQYLALRNASDQQYEQQRSAAQWEIWRNQNIGNEAAAASFDAFAGSASNALTGIISGSMSVSQAMQSLGNTVLNSLINTFVQMGAEWVRSAVMGSSAQIAATTATTTASVAGIATTTAASTAAAGTTMTAWLPAALVASIGSFGAAAAVGGAALLAGFGLISALSGKRKNGGPVSAGGMYQVGEGGMPEIYRASNGRQYMIPGDNGSVISNKDMQGGGGRGGVVVNVNNYTSSEVQTNAYNQNGVDYVDVFINDMESGGPIANTLQTTFGLNRRANGDY